MSVEVEKLEKSMAKLTITVDEAAFAKAIEETYQKTKGKISIPGFRKGKAPRKIIEQMYGEGVFYEDAANSLIPDAYDEAYEECGEDIVSEPEIEVTQIGAGKPFVFTATVALKPPVTLKKYKDLPVSVPMLDVTDEEVEARIKEEQKNCARFIPVDDRPAEMGDRVKLDFDGSIDGVPFEGGSAQDYPLELGSGSFIPGFEEQLAGVAIGETKDVTVTFPEDYGQKDLQGKEAVFTCTIHSIEAEELPELDDEFASDVSEYSTMEEYRAGVRKGMEETKAQAAKERKESEAIQALADNLEVDIPEPMMVSKEKDVLQSFSRQMEMQGLSLETYMQYMGATRAQLLEQMRPQAEQQIRSRLALEEVVRQENIEATDEDVAEEIKSMAEVYQLSEDKVKETLGERGEKDLRMDLAVRKAIAFITEHAKEQPADKQEKKAAAKKKTEKKEKPAEKADTDAKADDAAKADEAAAEVADEKTED